MQDIAESYDYVRGNHMGLCIALQDEWGKQIEFIADEKNLLDKLIAHPDQNAFPMLSSIDRYGDTVLNQIQMERFLIEWKTLSGKARSSEEQALLNAVQSIAEKSLRDVHQYLVFIGD